MNMIDMTGIKQLSKRQKNQRRDALSVAIFLAAIVAVNFIFIWVTK